MSRHDCSASQGLEPCSYKMQDKSATQIQRSTDISKQGTDTETGGIKQKRKMRQVEQNPEVQVKYSAV